MQKLNFIGIKMVYTPSSTGTLTVSAYHTSPTKTPDSSPAKHAVKPSPKTPISQALKIIQSPTFSQKLKAQPDGTPGRKAALNAAVNRVVGMPDTPGQTKIKQTLRLVKAVQDAVSADNIPGDLTPNDPDYHYNATKTLKNSPWLQGAYKDFFKQSLRNCVLTEPHVEKLAEGRVINLKHVAQGETSARGMRVGWHWIHRTDVYARFVDLATKVVNPKNNITVASFQIPGFNKKKSSFFPSDLFGGKAITEEKKLVKLIKNAEIEVEAPGETRFLAKTKCKGKEVWIEGYKAEDTDSFHTVYPLFICQDLPSNLADKVTIVARGCSAKDPSYELIRTAAKIKEYIEDSIETWARRPATSRENCPVHFMDDHDHVWVDIAPEYKKGHQVDFPLSSGVIFKCKVADLSLTSRAIAELALIKTRLS